MPKLSDTMQAGIVSRWLKQLGDQVEKGEVLVEIETDKATMELAAPESGILSQILIKTGGSATVGTPLGHIAAAEAPLTAPPSEAEAPPSPLPVSSGEPDHQLPFPPSPTLPEPDQVKASPLARQLAQAYGLDLHLIPGTGPGGRLMREDVEAFVKRNKLLPLPAVELPLAPPSGPLPASLPLPLPAHPPELKAGETLEPLSRMRRAIALKMSEAKPGIPHLYVMTEIEMTQALKLRQQINTGNLAGNHISVNDLIVKATAQVLRRFPLLNSSFCPGPNGEGGLIVHPQINLNVAVALAKGLVAPTLFAADQRSLREVAEALRDLATRAREGKLKTAELEEGTFTITNLGMYEVVEATAIITPPQAAALAVAAVRQVPVINAAGQVGIGEVLRVTLSVDHRVTDGVVAAQFLLELKRLLQTPLALLL